MYILCIPDYVFKDFFYEKGLGPVWYGCFLFSFSLKTGSKSENVFD